MPVRRGTAVRLADLYRQRWTIETVFQPMAETLSCEIQTLAYPKAALFAFCLALSAYNAVVVLRAALAAAHGREMVEANVSGYSLAKYFGTFQQIFYDDQWRGDRGFLEECLDAYRRRGVELDALLAELRQASLGQAIADVRTALATRPESQRRFRSIAPASAMVQ